MTTPIGTSAAGETRLLGIPSTPLPLVVFVALGGLLQPRYVVPGFGAAGRPAALFGVGLLVWWGFSRLLPVRAHSATSPILRACFVYLIVFFAAVISGLDRGLPGIEQRSMDRAILVTLGIGGVLLMARDTLRSYADIERVVVWLVAAGFIGAVVALIQFVFNIDLATRVSIPGLVQNADQAAVGTRGDVGYRRVRGLALHPIEYGVHLAMLLPLALHLAMTKPDRQKLRWFVVLVLGAGIPLSISRSGVLALAVAMGVFALGWTWRQRANALVAVVVGGLAFMAITPGLLGTIRSLFRNIGNDNSVAGRTGDYSIVGQFISERPLLGRGPGTFIPSQYVTLDNQFLATLLDSGWLGLLAMLGVLGAAALVAITASRTALTPERRSLARALGAGLAVAPVTFGTFDALGFPLFAGALVGIMACLVALHEVGFRERAATAAGGRHE